MIPLLLVLLLAPVSDGAGAAGVDPQTAPAIRSGFVPVEGGRLYYEESGSGPALLLNHDGLLHREAFDGQFSPFAAAGHRVVRYDRRGYGRSDLPTAPFDAVEDLRALMDALKIEKASVLGSSSGGMISIEFAVAHPGRVESLVLVGAIVRGLGFTEHFRTRGGHLTPSDEAPLAAKIAYWSGKDPFLIAPDHPAAKQRARELLSASPANLGDHHAFMRLPRGFTLARLAEIKVPTLILVGEKDIPDVHAHAGAIQAGIPGARRVVAPGDGHLPYLESPEAFNRLVLEFLDAPATPASPPR